MVLCRKYASEDTAYVIMDSFDSIEILHDSVPCIDRTGVNIDTNATPRSDYLMTVRISSPLLGIRFPLRIVGTYHSCQGYRSCRTQ